MLADGQWPPLLSATSCTREMADPFPEKWYTHAAHAIAYISKNMNQINGR